MKQHGFRLLPNGKRLFVGRARALVTGLLGAALLASIPAHAAAITVHLKVYRGQTPAAVQVAACSVSVSSGANAVAVLEAAKNTGCIQSYAVTTQYGFGPYLDCVNADCEIPRNNATAHGLVTYWRQSEGGVPTCYGIGGFEAAAGKQIELSYTATAGFAADFATGCKE